MPTNPIRCLTIGGSDSGGAAGIQADLKTFTALGAYGMSALTVVTAQNSVRVTAATYSSPDFLGQQLDAILTDYGADAIKTGFIGRIDLIDTILTHTGDRPTLVVDPVLVNHKGVSMFGDEVIARYRERLIPHATLATPNLREAELLANMTIATHDQMRKAAQIIAKDRPTAILIKSLPQNNKMVDGLWHNGQFNLYEQPRLETNNTHGSGDTLSAAITAFLGWGDAIPEAVEKARRITTQAIAGSADWQLGAGHGPLNHFNIKPHFQ